MTWSLSPLKARQDPLVSCAVQANVIMTVGGDLVPAAKSPASSAMLLFFYLARSFCPTFDRFHSGFYAVETAADGHFTTEGVGAMPPTETPV